ncbi:MAG: hypothetical protein KGR26_00370 [Cyanobacteria bacterium REEB65]|nr:hypothetical protein [Cyanobacteria bacterium REEB65]
MPEDARLAAAMVDAVCWGDLDWATSVALCVLGERTPTTSTRTERFFEDHGWRDVEDVFDAARVTQAQRWAFDLAMAGHTRREIGQMMGIETHAAEMQVIRCYEKLRRLLIPEVEEEAVT